MLKSIAIRLDSESIKAFRPASKRAFSTAMKFAQVKVNGTPLKPRLIRGTLGGDLATMKLADMEYSMGQQIRDDLQDINEDKIIDLAQAELSD